MPLRCVLASHISPRAAHPSSTICFSSQVPSHVCIKRRASDKGTVTFSPLLCHSLGPGSHPTRKTQSQDHQSVGGEYSPPPVLPKLQTTPPSIRNIRTSSSSPPAQVSPQDRCSSGQVVLCPSPLTSSLCRSMSREPEVSGDMLSYALRAATGTMPGSADDSPRPRYRSQGRSSQTSDSPIRIEKPVYPQAYSVSVYSSADNWVSGEGSTCVHRNSVQQNLIFIKNLGFSGCYSSLQGSG